MVICHPDGQTEGVAGHCGSTEVCSLFFDWLHDSAHGCIKVLVEDCRHAAVLAPLVAVGLASTVTGLEVYQDQDYTECEWKARQEEEEA